MFLKPLKISALFALAALLPLVLSAAHSEAASPMGVWKSNTGRHIQIFSCKGGIGMRIVNSSNPKHVGRVIMCGAKKTGANKWRGSLLNVDDGKTYTGIATLKGANSLQLEGCVLGGLICKKQVWPRIK